MIKNLVPVTLGNMIGGSIFVGLAFWVAYKYSGKTTKQESVIDNAA